ncbi:hypothetical protein YC2023_018904 [Brassica napus]
MDSIFRGNIMNKEEMEVVMNKAKEILGASFKVLELDEMSDGGEIQSAYLMTKVKHAK